MKGKQIKYSENELSWIQENRREVRRIAHAKFCDKFSRQDVSLKNYNSLCKRNGWSTGRTGQFQKNQQSWNKGKKMPYNPNSAKTQFKKGRKPHNTNFLGHERTTKDGYIEISVDEVNPHTGFDRRYVLKHKYLWEKENGKVPDKHCLKCLNGNKADTSPKNWELIPMAVNARLSAGRSKTRLRYDEAHDEVKPVLISIAKLEHAARELRK